MTIVRNIKARDVVKCKLHPRSTKLTGDKHYIVEWVSAHGSYVAVRNDEERIKPYSIDNFTYIDSLIEEKVKGHGLINPENIEYAQSPLIRYPVKNFTRTEYDDCSEDQKIKKKSWIKKLTEFFSGKK